VSENSEKKVILRAKNLHKAFSSAEDSIKVLQGVDMALHEGESISIRGESGAGKTTLLNLITLLERPDSGEVIWGEDRVEKKRNSWLARRRCHFMGLVFQAYYLIPELNALDNVLMARRLLGRVRAQDEERARYLMDQVGLKNRANHLTSQLSGGESQRVAIARALMNQPQILVADEPTGNLDENTGLGAMKLLLDLCVHENTGLILVTHNPDFAARTERQVHLLHGKLE